LALSLVSAVGCAGYHMGVRSLYAPDIETIFVPVFESNSFRPDLGERLTEAVIKEIEQKTPYKVVGNPDDADSVLSGRILSDEKRVLIENNNDAPRQLEAALAIEVRWANRRGDLIRAPGAVPLPPPLLTMQETAALVPEAGQSIATSQQEAIDNLATRIVEMMEIPW
jgi:hypothetical protein